MTEYYHVSICESCGREFHYHGSSPKCRKYCKTTCRVKGSINTRQMNDMMWKIYGKE